MRKTKPIIVGPPLTGSKPRHLALKQTLEKQIEDMAHGDRLPSTRELMQSYNVSQSTVDHALRDMESRRLILRRRRSGVYVNKRSGSRTHNRLVGVLLPDLTDPFCALIARGIESHLTGNDYKMVLCNGANNIQTELDLIASWEGKLDAAIVNPTTSNVHAPEFARYFMNLDANRRLPFLVLDIMIPRVNVPFIGLDNFKAFAETVPRLIRQPDQFSDIVYCGFLVSVVGLERLNGFRLGLEKAHVDINRVRIVNLTQPANEPLINWKSLQRRRPALFVAGTPTILPTLIRQLHEHNFRIPEDAVILSVTEENTADYLPYPVLELIKPSRHLGQLAADRIRQLIQGQPIPPETRLDLTLKIPDSIQRVLQP